jgi:hypothetical protein
VNRQECQRLVDAYVTWLRKGLPAHSLHDACELTTPFLDRHNDHLQVKTNGKIVLSDDGCILSDPRTSGVDAGTPKRKAAGHPELPSLSAGRHGKLCALFFRRPAGTYGSSRHTYRSSVRTDQEENNVLGSDLGLSANHIAVDSHHEGPTGERR